MFVQTRRVAMFAGGDEFVAGDNAALVFFVCRIFSCSCWFVCFVAGHERGVRKCIHRFGLLGWWARLLPTAATGFLIWLGTGGSGKEFLPAVLAAEVGRLSFAFGVESGGGVHGHAADGVDCFSRGCIHGFVSFFVVTLGWWQRKDAGAMGCYPHCPKLRNGQCALSSIRLPTHFPSETLRRRSAFRITDSEETLMAAPAIIGLSRIPTNG